MSIAVVDSMSVELEAVDPGAFQEACDWISSRFLSNADSVTRIPWPTSTRVSIPSRIVLCSTFLSPLLSVLLGSLSAVQ